MESLAEGHRQCDLLLAAAEQTVEAGEWAAFRVRIAELRGALVAQFTLQEEAAFPQFERQTGLREPTEQLCQQHQRMREILDALASASPAHDPEGCRAEFATLALLYRQHRETEEGVMVPVFDLVPDATPMRAVAPAAVPALDLRGLEPPQPMVRIFQALAREPDVPLHVVLPHEPLPLYGMLREHGFAWSGTPRADGGFELTIRKPGQVAKSD